MSASLLVLVALTMQGSAPAKPVASLHAQGGEVRIQRGSATAIAAKRLESVRLNDFIIVGSNGKALLKVEATRTVYSLQPGSKIQAQANGFKLVSGKSPVLFKQLTRFSSPDGYPPTLHTPVRGPKSELAPSGAMRNGPVTLFWEPTASTTEVRLELIDPKSNEQHWQAPSIPGTNKSYTLPSTAYREGTWYMVRVILRGPSPVVLNSPIKTLSNTERAELDKAEAETKDAFKNDPISLQLELASLYASFGLAQEMVKAVGLAYGKESDGGAANRTKGIFYAQCGLAPEALHHLMKAWDDGEHDDAVKALIITLGGEVDPKAPSGLPSGDLAALIQQRDQLVNSNKPSEALPIAEQVVAILTGDTFERGEALTHLGMILADLKRSDEGFPKANQGISLLGQHAKESSKGVAHRFFTLGQEAFNTRKLDSSKIAFEASLAITEKLTPGALQSGDTLTNLGIVERGRGNLQGASESYSRALAIYRAKAPGSGEEAQVLNNLANIHYAKGELDEAQRLLEASLAIKEKIDPNSPEIARSLTNLGIVALERGDLVAAQKFHERSLNLRERLAPGSMAVAGSQINLGQVALERGDLLEARRRYELALAIGEKQDPQSLTTAIALNNLGLLAQRRGDVAEAQRRFKAALAIQKTHAANSPDVTSGLNSLASVAFSRGDLEEAKELFTEVLNEERRRSPASVLVANCLGNLADVAMRKGDLAEAQRLHEAALEVWKKAAPNSMGQSSTLHSLGDLALRKGDFSMALQRHSEALDIRERLSPNSQQTALAQAMVGRVAYERGDLPEASRRYEAALAIQEKLAPFSLPVAGVIRELAILARTQGNEPRLIELSQKRFNIAERLLVSQTTGSELRAFGELANDVLAKISWLADPASKYEWLPSLRGAGLVLEARSAEAVRRSQSDPELRESLSALMMAKKAEMDWLARSPQPDAKLLELRSKRQSAEAELNRLLKAKDPRLSSDLRVNTAAVQAAIPSGSALIEYLKVDSWNGAPKYAAFVVAPIGPVKFIVLGDAKFIDKSVADFQELMALMDSGAAPTAGDERALASVLKALHASLIEPLGTLPESIYIAPDSALHSLPFNALMTSEGKYLIESKRISIVGSGRDLLDKPLGSAPSSSEVFAGPAFGGPTSTWAPLPGAEAEGAIAARSLGVQPRVNKQASEEALMQLNRPKVLHIATHGFYFPAPQAGYSGLALLESMAQRLAISDSPMMRSGIVLSGANTQREAGSNGETDGWVTALELAQLDLRGTELVALSGCETGRGDVAGAEGVFGMQRALKFAGAQTIIMSLFRVPDAASKTLFEAFYSKWSPGSSSGAKLTALRDAQFKLLRDPKTKHPKYWAGFALLGDR